MKLAIPFRRAAGADEDSIDRAPPLTWRKPAFVWLPVALILGVGWPYLLLRNEGGVALMAALGAGCVGIASAAALLIAQRTGVPPRTRRIALTPFLSFGLIAAFVLPLLFAILLAILNAVERAHADVTLKHAGLGVDMVLALWPLGVMIGLPYALFVGLCVVLVAMKQHPAPAPAETALTTPAPREPAGLF